MNTITIKLALTDAARTAHATRTGTLLPRESELPLNLSDLSPEQRAEVLAITGPSTHYHAHEVRVAPGQTHSASLVPTTSDEWLHVLREHAAARAAQRANGVAAELEEIARLMPELERMEALSDEELESARIISTRGTVYPETKDYDDRVKALADRTRAAHNVRDAKQRQQREEQNARSQERAREREAAAEARKAQAQADRAAWVTAHGSDYLKKAVGAGYDCQRLYVTERAAQEHPAYVVDYQDTARWNDRSCPSEAALDEALRVNGEVVWLTSHPADENIRQCEAVVIREYLGQYDLIRIYPE